MIKLKVMFKDGTISSFEANFASVKKTAISICNIGNERRLCYLNCADGSCVVLHLDSINQIVIEEAEQVQKLITRERFIEQELSTDKYEEFIQELINDNDLNHPTYEEWRKELEPDVIEDANEKQMKGELL